MVAVEGGRKHAALSEMHHAYQVHHQNCCYIEGHYYRRIMTTYNHACSFLIILQNVSIEIEYSSCHQSDNFFSISSRQLTLIRAELPLQAQAAKSESVVVDPALSTATKIAAQPTITNRSAATTTGVAQYQ